VTLWFVNTVSIRDSDTTRQTYLPVLFERLSSNLNLWLRKHNEPGADEAPCETWHLPGGPIGPPARWAATPNVEEGRGTDKGAQDS